MAVANPCGNTGDDFSGDVLAIQNNARRHRFIAGSDQGGGGACVGIFVSSYTDTSITFTFGSAYGGGGPYVLDKGNHYVVFVNGATHKGRVKYT